MLVVHASTLNETYLYIYLLSSVNARKVIIKVVDLVGEKSLSFSLFLLLC